LPTGLTLNTTTGVISGTPTVNGTYNFTVQVTDTVPNSATKALSIVITGSALIITTTSLPQGQVGVPYSTTIHATGGTPPYVWSVTFGAIPGLGINSSTGVYSGTPTVPGVYAPSIQATDANNVIAVRPLPGTIIKQNPLMFPDQFLGTNKILGGVQIQ
jgi:hypothetical protein